MTQVVFEDATLKLDEGESLLDGLLRSGHEIAHGCKAGVCHSCLVAVDEGTAPAASQKGLNDAQTALGYMLSCQCHPEDEIKVKRVDAAGQLIPAEVIEKEWLNEQVIRLRLKAKLDYQPGQYVTLWKDASLARSYSLASLPDSSSEDCSDDNELEFHIKVIEDGQFSQWVAKELSVSDSLSLQGPLGKCFYTAHADQALLLAAIGTGLAPIYGILKDALNQGHHGPIDLVIGAKQASNLYLVDELKAIADQHSNVSLHFVVQSLEAEASDLHQGDIYEYCQNTCPDMKGFKVYLCGADSFVKKLRKQCFLSGAGMGDIAADVFLPAS